MKDLSYQDIKALRPHACLNVQIRAEEDDAWTYKGRWIEPAILFNDFTDQVIARWEQFSFDKFYRIA